MQNSVKALKRRHLIKMAKKHKFLYIMFLPVVAYYIVFNYTPLIMGAVMSLKNYKLGGTLGAAEWVGLDNYRLIFENKDVLNAVKNTLTISLLKLAFGFVPPIVLALCLFDISNRFYKRFAQTIVYIPYFFSWVIVYGVFWAFFSTGNGLVNLAIENIFGRRVNFFLDHGWFLFLLVISSIWKYVGWSSILYLAALTSVNPELFEAARVDGCGPLRRVWYITLPSILPIISFVLTLNIGSLLSSDFEQILMFYNTQVLEVADVISTWVYRIGLNKFKYSLGAAVGMLNGVISMVLIILGNRISRRVSGRGMW